MTDARERAEKRVNPGLTLHAFRFGCGRRYWATEAEGGQVRRVTEVRLLIRIKAMAGGPASAWDSPGSDATPKD